MQEWLSTARAARMCPKCGEDSRVYKCWERGDGVVVRRRECRACGEAFETLELLSRCVKRRKRRKKPPKTEKIS